VARKKNKKERTVVADVASSPAETVAAGVEAAERAVGTRGRGGARKASSDKKGQEKDGRKGGKKKARKKDKASRAEKREKKRDESGMRELTRLASRARKRLLKLVNRLGHASARRDALLDELTALQKGIAAGVERFGRDAVSNRSRGARKQAR
jgi:hypothetical protein